MNLIELILPVIIGLTIGITSGINTTDEPVHIQLLGMIVAVIIIILPVRITLQMFI